MRAGAATDSPAAQPLLERSGGFGIDAAAGTYIQECHEGTRGNRMRVTKTLGPGLTVRAVAGTHVVFRGFSMSKTAASGLLGFGIDAAVEVSESADLTTTAVGIPLRTLRAGFRVSDRTSIEPRISFTFASVEGNSATFVVPTLGLVYDFVTDPTRTRPFVRPFAAFISTSNGTSTSQAIVGGAVGVRMPMGSRIAARLELQGAYGFETDTRPSLTSVSALVGVSFFTK